MDLADVAGHEQAKRALLIAAAGGHSLLLYGPPGSGKTLLARRLATILPPPTTEEAIEIAQVLGAVRPAGPLFPLRRPFRAPHHSISQVGLLGGGPRLRPGEVTLAHRGVLFLDEFLEFRRDALEALRQPLEDGRVLVGRAKGWVEFPAEFALVAAMNPWGCAANLSCHPENPEAAPGRLPRATSHARRPHSEAPDGPLPDGEGPRGASRCSGGDRYELGTRRNATGDQAPPGHLPLPRVLPARAGTDAWRPSPPDAGGRRTLASGTRTKGRPRRGNHRPPRTGDREATESKDDRRGWVPSRSELLGKALPGKGQVRALSPRSSREVCFFEAWPECAFSLILDI